MTYNGQLTDFDIWQKAVNQIDLTEAAAPLVRGRVLLNESEVEMYNKIQKLLNSTGMESCHKFLYSLDPSDLTETECEKINSLWDLGVSRGVIEVEPTDEDEENEENSQTDECDLAAEPVDDVPTPMPTAAPCVPLSQNAFTVMYSATRDGAIKTGEAYSNCINTRSAKADVISKLERAGYQNISILAIEAADPDAVCCDNTYCKQAERPAINVDDQTDDIPDYDDLGEADHRDPMAYALSPAKINASSATLKGNYVASTSTVSDDNCKLMSTEDEGKKATLLDLKKAWAEAGKETKNIKTLDDVKKILTSKKSAIDKFLNQLKTKDNKVAEKLENIIDNVSKVQVKESELNEHVIGATIVAGAKLLVRLLLSLIWLTSKGVSISSTAISFVLSGVKKISDIIAKGTNSLSKKMGEAEDDEDDLDSVNEEGDEESSDDEESEEKDDESKDDEESDDSDDSDDTDDSDDGEEEEKEEEPQEPDEKIKDDNQLTDEEKQKLKDAYKKAYKAALQKCKFNKSFSELGIDDKVEFFTVLAKGWANKPEPSKFMSDKEEDQLEKIVIKKGG